MKAYAASTSLRSAYSLLCFGGCSFKAEERQSISALGVASDRVIQTDGDVSLLGEVYRCAAVFVFPSFYEGFGIPSLEAMHMGCPVVASNASSLPEVIGDAGEYCDPVDSASISDAIERIVSSSELRSALIEKGRSRSALFSWQRCAEETLAVYRGLL